jgi:hypothetical protein
VKADPTNPVQELKEAAPPYGSAATGIGGDVDISLLRASLAMTPWERMKANDDALNFGESLRAAMKKRNEQSL